MDKKRIDRIVREEVATLLEGWKGYGNPMYRKYDSTRGDPEIDDYEAGKGTYRPRRPAGPASLMGAGLSRTQGELFVIPRTGLLNIRLYPDNLDAVGGAVESKLFRMPEGITVRIVNFKNQSEVEGTLEVKSVSEEGRNVLKGYEAKIRMGGTEFFGEGQRAADAIAAADDARAAASAGGAEIGPLSEARWAKLSGLNEAGPRIGAYGGEEPRGGYFKSGYRDPEGRDEPSGPKNPSYMTMSDRDFDRAVAKSAEIMAGGVTGGPRTKTDVRGSGDVILSAEMSTNDMSYSGIKIPASIGERLGQPDGDMVRVSNEIKMLRAALPGGVVGTGSTEIDGSGYGGGGYKVTGTNIGTAGGYGPRRSFVGTGGTIEDAYRAMLDKVIATYENARDREVPSDVRAIRQWASVGVPGGGMSSLSESRWGQLAGLMTEGKRSKVSPAKKGEAQKLFVDDEDGEPILYMGPAGMSHSAAMEAKGKLRKVTPGQALAAMKDDPDMAAEASGTDDRDEIMGHLRDMAEDRKEAGKLKRGARAMPEPADLDEADSPKKRERPGAPGAVRPPEKVDPSKGPPGKKDLDAIEKLGPFERKKR